MRTFGLIGNPLEHSFSPAYFQEKFAREKIFDATYQLFPLLQITDLQELVANQKELEGFNVTIPYKTTIFPYLDEIDEAAAEIGAVNVVKINRIGNEIKLTGYNSDWLGFERSLKEFLPQLPSAALVLGTGGAAKAVSYALRKNNIDVQFASRTRSDNTLIYSNLTEEIIAQYPLIVNASPVGMSPHINECPDLPYAFLSARNALFDLVYNPTETLFLQKGKQQGASICNGLQMLHYQADISWEIWNANSR